MTSNRNVEGICPLSPQQQGMLFETLRSEATGVFVEQEVHTLRGPIDITAFTAAWRHIIDQHAILRTAFVWKTRREPLQVVFNEVEPPIEFQDICRSPSLDQRALLQRYLEADRVRGFDLSQAPLFRIALFRTHEDACELVWTQHHILYDGWCRPLLFQQLASFYASYAQGTQPPAGRARPYSDYVAWVAKQDSHAAEQFWHKELAGFHSPSRLGTLTASVLGTPPGGSYAEIERRHPTSQTALLETLAKQKRVTMSTVLHGAWALLLARYNDASDVIFGSTVSGRPAELPGVESIVGPFITTLPIRVQVDRDSPCADWLPTVQARHARVRQFEYCSAGQVQQWSELPAGTSLFESVLVFENYPAAVRKDWSTSANSANSRFIGGRTPYTLTLLITPGPELSFRAIFQTDRIGWAAVSRILDHMDQVLRRIVLQPAERIGELLASIPQHLVPNVYAPAAPKAYALHSAPSNPLEERVAAAASDLLGLPRVSMADRFLDLGGHSLVAMQLVSRLREDLQVDIPLRLVFECTDLRQLAQQVGEAISRKVESLSDEEAARLLANLSTDRLSGEPQPAAASEASHT